MDFIIIIVLIGMVFILLSIDKKIGELNDNLDRIAEVIKNNKSSVSLMVEEEDDLNVFLCYDDLNCII